MILGEFLEEFLEGYQRDPAGIQGDAQGILKGYRGIPGEIQGDAMGIPRGIPMGFLRDSKGIPGDS